MSDLLVNRLLALRHPAVVFGNRVFSRTRLSGFHVFLKEHVAAGSNPAEEVVPLGEKWRSMTAEEKEPYNKKIADMQRELDAKVMSGEVRNVKDARRYLRACRAVPPKRPGNAFSYFVKDQGKEEGSFVERARMVGEKWKTLSAAERQAFVEKATVARQTFQEEERKWQERLESDKKFAEAWRLVSNAKVEKTPGKWPGEQETLCYFTQSYPVTL